MSPGSGVRFAAVRCQKRRMNHLGNAEAVLNLKVKAQARHRPETEAVNKSTPRCHMHQQDVLMLVARNRPACWRIASHTRRHYSVPSMGKRDYAVSPCK